ncbi:MAG TPA: C40 family peptidase [Cellulomonas sp.]
MTDALTAVQARITELRTLIDPSTDTSTSSSTSTTSSTSSDTFAAALAALGLSSTDLTSTSSTSTQTSIAPESGATGSDLVEAATQYLGVPYVWGGESLDEGGLDCSGLVQRSLADLGITDVPRTASEQATLGEEVDSLDDAQPGDLLVFGGGTHIGIYVGDGQMIDAPSAGKTVSIRDVYTEPTTIRRILPSESSASTSTSSSSSSSAASLSALSSLVSSASGQSALALLTGSTSTTDLSGVLSALLGSGTSSSSALSSLSSLSALTGSSTTSSSTSSSSLLSSSLLSSLWGSAS